MLVELTGVAVPLTWITSGEFEPATPGAVWSPTLMLPDSGWLLVSAGDDAGAKTAPITHCVFILSGVPVVQVVAAGSSDALVAAWIAVKSSAPVPSFSTVMFMAGELLPWRTAVGKLAIARLVW